MNVWGEEDQPPPVEAGTTSRHRMQGRHIIVVGLAVALLCAVPYLLGVPALGSLLVTLGVSLMVFGGAGWCLELLGWDGMEDGSGSARITDMVRLANRNDQR